jgi:hypothetical protein
MTFHKKIPLCGIALALLASTLPASADPGEMSAGVAAARLQQLGYSTATLKRTADGHWEVLTATNQRIIIDPLTGEVIKTTIAAPVHASPPKPKLPPVPQPTR